jgi:hypothetical protein
MADDKSSIFTKKASEKLRSPDDLDEYVRVTNPSVWVVLAACTCLMIGMLAWGFLGTVETSVSAVATFAKEEVICFLPAEDASKVHVGDSANVGGELMEVASVGAVPLSRAEVREVVGGDYLASTLVEDDWTYLVSFEGGNRDFEQGIPLSATITIERIKPISLIFKDVA